MKRILLILAAFAMAATAVFAQPQELPNDPETRVGKLDNGLTYYIRHNDKPAQRAEFYLATNVGAIQETPEQDGLAHFLEHMCFNGTENFPGKTLLEYLQSIGVEFGRNINASTGVEQTEYMLNNVPVIREGIVDTCLLIMHDYSHYVTNDPIEIDKERGVIVEEKRTRNTASWRMYDQSKKYLYAGSKYADCSLIGSEENLYNFKPETLVDFYHTWYRPDLQALVVVGDIDVDTVEAKVKELFSTIPNPENPQPKEAYAVPDNEEPIVGILTDKENTGTTVEIYWKDEPMPREMKNTNLAYLTDLVYDFLYYVMDERFSDITAKADAPFLSAVVGHGGITQTCDVTLARAQCKDGEALPAFRALLTEVVKLVRFGITEDEFSRAKDEILSQLEQAVEAADTRKNAEFVEPILSNFFDNEPFMAPATELEFAQGFCSMLNSAIINQMLSGLISDDNIVIIYKAPDKEGLEHPAESDFLALIDEVENSEIQANEAVEIGTELLDPETLPGSAVASEEEGLYGSTVWTLGNGVKVVALPTQYKKDQILIQIFKSGGLSLISDEDLPSFESNIRSTFEGNSGLGPFPKTTLDKMLSGVQASVVLAVSKTEQALQAKCPPKDLEKAFQMLYLKFTDHRFDPEEYAVGRKTLEAILPNFVNTPNYILSRECYESWYGKDNPRNLIISEEILEKASLETYEKIYTQQLFKDAAGAVVYIVGNFDTDAIRPLVEKYIGSLPEGEKAFEPIEENLVKTRTGRLTDDFTTPMEAPKTTVYQTITTTEGISYSVKNAVAYSALEYIMQMIYTDTLREDEGGTYGAGVNCSIIRDPFEQAEILVAFDTKPESADKLRQMAVDNFRELAENGPSEEYFNRTIENFKKNLPESRINNGYWINNLKTWIKFGDDYDTLYEEAVNSLTPADVQAVAKTLIDCGNFIEIVMRPAATEEVAPEAATEEEGAE